MRTQPKPISIEQEGLEKYLNRTADTHNNLDYKDLVKLLESGVDKANLARAFSVSSNTMYKWLNIFSKEGSNG